jgi:surfeit locus 1 family protein
MTLRARKLIIPTIMTAVMLIVLIALGLWQLQRMAWKETMLKNLALPVLVLSAPAKMTADMELRRVQISCPEVSFADVKIRDYAAFTPQYRAFTKCPGVDGIVVVDHGFNTTRGNPIANPRRQFEGTVREWQPESWALRVAGAKRIKRADFGAAGAVSPFFVKAGPPPKASNIANNHFAYAIQWFAFAGVLTVIYGLFAVRLWRDSAQD